MGDTADSDPERAPRTPVETLPVDGGSEVATAAPTAKQAAPRKSQVNESFTTFEAAPEAVAEQQPAASPKATPPAEQTVEDPVAATRDQAPVEPPPATPRPRETEPISFWELPQSVRDSLPDLRITVLVYAEQPGDRFVLIGGNRVVEKDQLQDGVVLDEIRRDGAVFTYRNYRFLVKG
jgi:general secretion pathway protein B